MYGQSHDSIHRNIPSFQFLPIFLNLQLAGILALPAVQEECAICNNIVINSLVEGVGKDEGIVEDEG